MNRFAVIALISSAALAAPPQHPRGGRMPTLTPADEAAIKGYDLSEGKIDKLLKVGLKMREYANAHPEVRDTNIMEGKSLEESATKMESKPESIRGTSSSSRRIPRSC